MASLKFIMHLDDDQLDSVSPQTAITRANTASHSEPSTGIRPIDLQESRHASRPSAQSRTSGATNIRGVAATTTSVSRGRAAALARNSRASRTSSALASVSGHESPRRQSNTSNDSMDQISYGSADSSSSRSGSGRLRSSDGLTRPMVGPAPSEVPVRFTPITGRVSRARKGQPVHKCELCRPPKVRLSVI